MPSPHDRAKGNHIVLTPSDRWDVVRRRAGKEIRRLAAQCDPAPYLHVAPRAEVEDATGRFSGGGIRTSAKSRRALFVIPVSSSDSDPGRHSRSRQDLKADARRYVETGNIGSR